MNIAVIEKTVNPIFGIDPELYRQFMNWREQVFSVLTKHTVNDDNLCMNGKIRTKQKCPKCQGNFVDSGKTLVCPTCLTIPTRYYIDIYWHKKYKIYSDQNGKVLSSYELANRVLTEIRQAIDKYTFDPKNYVAADLKANQFECNIYAWLRRQEIRLKKNEIAPSYYEKVKYYTNKYFIKFFGTKDVRSIRNAEIEDFQMQLPEHLSLKTTKNIMSVLHKYFNDLEKRHEIAKKPIFPDIKISEPHWNWAGVDVQNGIYEKIPESHKFIFLFMKETGCRPGEARAIWKEDINFEEKWVIIRRSFSEDVYRETTKSKCQRIIPLDDDLVKELKKIPVISGFLFLDEYGKPYTRCHVWRIYNRARKDAGIEERLTLYQWGRHSWASQAVNNGVPENIIGAYLGHSDPRMTKKYAHTNLDGLKIALAKRKKARIYKLRPQRGPRVKE